MNGVGSMMLTPLVLGRAPNVLVCVVHWCVHAALLSTLVKVGLFATGVDCALLTL